MESVEFGKYVLLRQIGTGRIGQVWKAKVLGVKGLEKYLAVKKLHPHLSTEKAVIDIFMDAASSLVHLQHENIVRVYDFGTAEGTPYLAMDFIAGRDLARFATALRNKGQALGVEEALYIAIEVCRALEFAHSFKGGDSQPGPIIHGGLRPQNVLITRSGEVRVTDFSISRALFEGLEDKEALFEKTVPYLAPEMVTGEPATPATDVFCLGVLLCELVTGRSLVEGPSSELVRSLNSEDWDPRQLIPEDLAPSLQEILARAIAPKPRERYATAAEMLKALEEYGKEIGAGAEPESLARYMDTLFGDAWADEEQADEETGDGGAEQLAGELAVSPREKEKIKVGRGVILAGGIGAAIVIVILAVFLWPGKGNRKETPVELARSEQVAQETVPSEQVQVSSAQTSEEPREAEQPEAQPPSSEEQVGQEQAGFQEETEQPQGMEERNPKVEQAMKALEQEKYGEAVRIFQEVLSEAPGLKEKISAPYAEALVGEAVRIEDKKPARARRLLLKAVELNPDSVEGNFHLGLLYVEAKKYGKAIERYNKVIKLDPQYADAYFNLGYVYAVTKKWDKAEKMYQEVVKLAPPYLDEALFNLAMVQRRLGKRDACIENLKRAVIVNPKNKLAKKYLQKMTGK